MQNPSEADSRLYDKKCSAV